MSPPLEPGNVKPMLEHLLPHKMVGHELLLIPIESDGPIGSNAKAIYHGAPVSLYLIGAVSFSDWNLTERWMRFCHKYTPSGMVGGDGRFVPIDNSDYEYED